MYLSSNMSESPLTLDLLPVEILNELFLKLSPRFLQGTVRLVCKRFALILSDDAFWKMCYRHRYKTNKFEYPLLLHYGLHAGRESEQRFRCGDDISWREITYRLDKRESLWGTASNVNCRYNQLPHAAIINVVKIFPNDGICASGGRDQLLCLWNLDPSKNALILAKGKAHDGWVWDIAICQQGQFFSCGWDSTIKGWNLSDQLNCFKEMSTPSGPMCLDVIPGLLVAGLINGEVLLLDPRVAVLNAIHQYSAHSRTVTSLKMLENKVYSVSEDKTITIYDIRNLAVISSNKIKLCESAFPRKIAAYRDLIYVGDTKGSVSIYNSKENFDKPITCLKVGDNRPVNSLIPTLEGVIVGTANSGVKMVLPSNPIQVIREFDMEDTEATSMDFYRNHFVVATTDIQNSIHFYTAFES